MANAIPGFSPEESEVIRRGFREGKLSDSQKREIIRRSEEAVRTLPSQPGPPESAEEITGGLANRGVFSAAGGLAGGAAGAAQGAALGLPAGPVGAGIGGLLGGIAGGALGSAGGSFAFDTFEDALRFTGQIEGEQATLGERAGNALAEGATDAGFSAAFPVIAQPLKLLTRGVGRLIGVTSQEARRAAETAKFFGIGVGATEVGNDVPRILNKALNVFPMTGSPARKAFADKGQAAEAAVNSTLNTMAPNAIMTSNLGVSMFDAAQATSKEFRRVAGVLYDQWRSLMQNASTLEIVPTEEMRKLGSELAKETAEGQVTLVDGETLTSPVMREVRSYLEKLAKLPERISFAQYQKLEDEFADLAAKAQSEGRDLRISVRAKEALETDLRNFDTSVLPEEEGLKIIEAHRLADRFYSQGIVDAAVNQRVKEIGLPPGFAGKETLESPTAKRFERADKNLFNAGPSRRGFLNEDELADVVANLKSPQAVNDLRAMVGDDLVKAAARRHVQNAFEESAETVSAAGREFHVFKANRLRRALGLDQPTKKAPGGVRMLLKIAGVPESELRALIDTIESIEPVGDAATFVMRGVILGGAGGIAGAAGVGGAVASGAAGGLVGSSITFLALTALARNTSKIISTPGALKAMQTALDRSATDGVRRQALGRVVRLLNEGSKGASRESERRQKAGLPPQG